MMEIFKIVLDLKYRNKTSTNIIVKIMQNIVTIKEVILTRENIARMENCHLTLRFCRDDRCFLSIWRPLATHSYGS